VDRRLGVVLASVDPIALDLAAVRLMGFDESRIPKISETMATPGLRLSSVGSVADVEVREVIEGSFETRAVPLADLMPEECFAAHPGWQGHVEMRSGGTASCAE